MAVELFPVNDLPSELLQLIFSFLSRDEAERSAAQVCKRWRCEILATVPLQVRMGLCSVHGVRCVRAG